MRKISRLVMIIPALFLLLVCSCSQDREVLSVDVSETAFDGESLRFKLTVSGAERLSWSVFPVAAGYGEEVFADSAVTQYISVPDIKENEKYVIKATAYAENGGIVEDMEVMEAVLPAEMYDKKVLITKFTGTWCGWCPYMTQALEDLEEFYPDGFVVMAMHSGDDLEVRDAVLPLEEKFAISGYPTAVLDYAYTSSQQMGMLRNRMDETLSENKAVVSIALTAEVSGGEILVDSEVEFGAAGSYRVCCVLQENRIYREDTYGSFDGWYDHVVRAFATDVEGDPVDPPGVEGKKSLEFSFPIQEDWNVDNCEVLVYVLRENTEGVFTVNNAGFCSVTHS